MEYQKIANLLGNISDSAPKFITKNWIEVHDQFGGSYSTNKRIRIKTSILQSDLCDYSNAYIVVKGTITVEGANNRDRKNKSLAFKNNAPFISCISKINSVLPENAEDLDVMPLFSLLGYGKNYSKMTGSLGNYVIDSKSFKYKTSITGFTYNVAERITNAGGNEVDNPAYDANK